MKALLITMLVAALAGCAGVPAGPADAVFADARFAPPTQPVSSRTVFAISPEMRDFMVRSIEPEVGKLGAARGLFEALNRELKVDYDTEFTRNAPETFAARSGNCLSLVILTASFAKELGVSVSYQEVYGHDTWSRSGGVNFLSSHVNVVIGPKQLDDIVVDKLRETLIFDFFAKDQAGRFHSHPVSEETVVAMYFNNRAAESMVAGGLDDAYWLAREAIRTSPAFLSAYNTLGVIYLRHDNLPEAERALRYVLDREPDNANALSNLLVTMKREGRADEAEALRVRLAEIAPYPPFYFLDQGLVAIGTGEYDTAIELLRRELRRMPYDDQVHFALAVAEMRKGQLSDARDDLALALENSPTRDRRDIYAAKLNALNKLDLKH